MAAPSITLSCDCGEKASVALGDRWTCPTCGKTYDTRSLPQDEVDALFAGVRRYRAIVLGPPLLAAAILIPLAVLVGARWGYLFFVLVVAWGLLVVPQLRRRATRHVRESTSRWKLEPE